jgi:hypothetical protein
LLLTRYAAVAMVYRAPQARSDQRRGFGQKLGLTSTARCRASPTQKPRENHSFNLGVFDHQ